MMHHLTETQCLILAAAERAGLHSDGIRVRGARVRSALLLDAMGLVRTADLTAYGDGAQVRILQLGVDALALRDPGLPPTARDGCASAAGDAIEE